MGMIINHGIATSHGNNLQIIYMAEKNRMLCYEKENIAISKTKKRNNKRIE